MLEGVRLSEGGLCTYGMNNVVYICYAFYTAVVGEECSGMDCSCAV